MIDPIFRYAFLAAPSAVADAPKAAAPSFAAPVAFVAALAAAAATAAPAPFGGARS